LTNPNKRYLTLSVSTIVAMEHDPARILYRRYTPGMSEGARIHLEMGFTNKKSFSKIIDDVVVSGVPDRVTNGVIEDLKTYYTEESRAWYSVLAHCQCNLYCYLAGLKKYRIFFYHVPSGKMDTVERDADFKAAESLIKRSVRKWKRLHKLLGIRK